MWHWYAFVAMTCFALLQLTFAYLTRKGMASPSMLLFVFGFGAFFYLVHARMMRTPIPTEAPAFALLATAAALSYVGNLCSVRALGAAPNPGYALAIVGLQATVVTVTSIFVLGATLTWSKAVGVFLCWLGMALLVV